MVLFEHQRLKNYLSEATSPLSDNKKSPLIRRGFLWCHQELNPKFPQTVLPVLPQVAVGNNQSFNGGSGSPTVIVQPPDNSEVVDTLKSIEKFLSDPLNRQAYILGDILKKHQEEETLRTSISQSK